jgi:predicted metal-dependent phosphoesterase TrpH
VFGDPKDNIKHTPKELIEKAAELKYEVLAITTHKKVIFSEELRIFAEQKGIVLLSGIELQIKGKHVLAINVIQKIENVRSFEDLYAYKNSHPECLIIAPHPFFISGSLMKKKLIKNIDLFDAIEHSFFYTKMFNLNKPAVKIAKKYGKPMVATSDCHILRLLDLGYTMVNAEKNPNSIIKAIKNNQLEISSKPLSIFKLVKSFLRMFFTLKVFRN